MKKSRKNNIITYCVIYPNALNVYLIKSVGMIPFCLYKKYHFNSKIVSYKIDNKYSYLDKFCKGLKQEFVQRNRFVDKIIYNIRIPIIIYLIKHSKEINILSVYHLTNQSLAYCLIYKLLNRNGITYIKADALEVFKEDNKIKENSYSGFKDLIRKGFFSSIINGIRIFFGKRLNKILLNSIDLLSIESKEIYNEIRNFLKIREKIIYIPNGIDDEHIKTLGFKRFSYKDKENIILTVGRLGTYQKATEVLLEAIPKISALKDWKIILIGPINNKFIKYIKDYFKNYPQLKDRVIFTGEIKDRKKLYDYYRKSKIFCLPSRFESFGIVLTEAGYFGDYIVCSNMPTGREITKNGELGKLFKIGDSNELANILSELITNEEILKNNYQKIQTFIKENFLYENIVSKLYHEIAKRI